MSEAFQDWLTDELKERGWSNSELARRANLTHGAVSNVISGRRNAGPGFVVMVAIALGVPPEKLLRIAGLLPTTTPSEGETMAAEIAAIAESLPASKRKQLLDFARFLQHGGQ